jgi:hypothetical protein
MQGKETLFPQLLDGHVLLTVLFHYFTDSHFKIFLSDVNTSFAKSIHTGFSTNSLYGMNGKKKKDMFKK